MLFHVMVCAASCPRPAPRPSIRPPAGCSRRRRSTSTGSPPVVGAKHPDWASGICWPVGRSTSVHRARPQILDAERQQAVRLGQVDDAGPGPRADARVDESEHLAERRTGTFDLDRLHAHRARLEHPGAEDLAEAGVEVRRRRSCSCGRCCRRSGAGSSRPPSTPGRAWLMQLLGPGQRAGVGGGLELAAVGAEAARGRSRAPRCRSSTVSESDDDDQHRSPVRVRGASAEVGRRALEGHRRVRREVDRAAEEVADERRDERVRRR